MGYTNRINSSSTVTYNGSDIESIKTSLNSIAKSLDVIACAFNAKGIPQETTYSNNTKIEKEYSSPTAGKIDDLECVPDFFIGDITNGYE